MSLQSQNIPSASTPTVPVQPDMHIPPNSGVQPLSSTSTNVGNGAMIPFEEIFGIDLGAMGNSNEIPNEVDKADYLATMFTDADQ